MLDLIYSNVFKINTAFSLTIFVVNTGTSSIIILLITFIGFIVIYLLNNRISVKAIFISTIFKTLALLLSNNITQNETG